MQLTHTKDNQCVTSVHGYSVNGKITVAALPELEVMHSHHPVMADSQSFNHHQLLLNQAVAHVNKAVSDLLALSALMARAEQMAIRVMQDHQDEMARFSQR